MRELAYIQCRIQRKSMGTPEQHGGRAERTGGRCRSEAWLRGAHIERVCARGARDGMSLFNTVFGRAAVDSTWSNDSYPNEPYYLLSRADLTAAFGYLAG